MFQTVLTGDLPSTERPGAAHGDAAFARSHDRVAHGSAHLLDALRRAFANAGVLDIAWIRVDDEVVYADRTGTTQDEVEGLVRRAARDGYLGRPFFQLELGLVHLEEGVSHVLVAQLRTSVPAGEPELLVQVASRPEEVLVRAGKSAQAYAARLKAWASNEASFQSAAHHAEALRDRLQESLKGAFPDATVGGSPARLVLVRPAKPELAALDRPRFASAVVQPRYDLSLAGRWPHWPSVFAMVWDDPYVVVRDLVLLDALMQDGFLRHEGVVVVEPDGKTLFDGARASLFAAWPWRKRFAVAYGEERVVVTFS